MAGNNNNKKKNTKLKVKNINLVINSGSKSNTIISVADKDGNVLKNFSAGEKYRGKAKGSQAAIEELFANVIDFCAPGNIKQTNVILRGTGIGVGMAGSLICAKRNGVDVFGCVESISYDSNVKYGGTRSRKQRRG
jgi:ribosomal protein S11